MIRTIKTCNPYQPIAQEIFRVDQLSEKEVISGAFYRKDISSKSYIMSQHSGAPETCSETDKLAVPLLLLAANPVILKKEEQDALEIYGGLQGAKMHYLSRAKEAIDRQIDFQTSKVVNAACPVEHTINVSDGFLLDSYMEIAFSCLMEHNIEVDKIVMPPMRFNKFVGSSQMLSFKNVVKDSPIRAYYRENIPVYVSTAIPKNAVYVLGGKDYLGVLPSGELVIRETEYVVGEKTGRTTTDNVHIRYFASEEALNKRKELYAHDWTVFINIGFAAINDWSISKIIMGS